MQKQPQPSHRQTIGNHAVVIGASMGGLLAARVLADAYRQVTILERDSFPIHGEQRKGVPQGRHAHALLPAGRAVLEELFPGLCQELVAQGAMLADSVQAAVQAMDSRDAGLIEDKVQEIINLRVKEGQLDDCPLTFHDLDIILQSFLMVLSGIHHQRVSYAAPEALPEAALAEERASGEKAAKERTQDDKS